MYFFDRFSQKPKGQAFNWHSVIKDKKADIFSMEKQTHLQTTTGDLVFLFPQNLFSAEACEAVYRHLIKDRYTERESSSVYISGLKGITANAT